jgi:hypothetical protein
MTVELTPKENTMLVLQTDMFQRILQSRRILDEHYFENLICRPRDWTLENDFDADDTDNDKSNDGESDPSRNKSKQRPDTQTFDIKKSVFADY